MLLKFSAVVVAAFTLASCGSNSAKEETKEAPKAAEATMKMDSSTAKKELYTNVKFDLAKDPVCNMPVTAGIEDTSHYKDKVYGFCSKECKDEFLKDPAAYLVKK